MPEEFDKLTGTIGDTLKTAPTLNEDASQPTVPEVDKLVLRAINAAFSNLDKYILNKENALDETKNLLEKKLENVDSKKIVPPEPYVAVPAIQAISFSMHSKVLRNLYANLLAKAMNCDTKNMVHPSFIEIIRQMSPVDAMIFRIIKESNSRPLITIDIKNKNTGGQHPYAKYCSWITDFSLEQCRLSFAFLCRLGMIEISPISHYTVDSNYNSVRQNPAFKKIEEKCLHTLSENQEIVYIKNYIKLNDLSDLFYDICVKDEISCET